MTVTINKEQELTNAQIKVMRKTNLFFDIASSLNLISMINHLIYKRLAESGEARNISPVRSLGNDQYTIP